MAYKFHEYGHEFPLTVQGIYNSCREVPRYQSLFHSMYETDYEWLKKSKAVSVGDLFKPFDNSHCIDLETGEQAYLTPTFCCPCEVGACFKIVDEPYWSLTKNVFDIFVPYLFVNVISTKTGRYYRVLFK
jgi:hypothetical protein